MASEMQKSNEMVDLGKHLRIGEKIGLSSAIVGLLFLTVIWQYHLTLKHALADYQRLQEVFEAKKIHALEIQEDMLKARNAETAFLLHRREDEAAELERLAAEIHRQDSVLKKIDADSPRTAGRIDELISVYLDRFRAVAEAWRKKGLDHNSGLQGAFRDSVHKLEALAGEFKVGTLYLQLLQIRRGEKDLGLRREDFYRVKVLQLVDELRDKVGSSKLAHDVKVQLWHEIETYRTTFEEYARNVLDQKPLRGGKGPFRDAAHRIEDILEAHYVPDMEENILQLRRREKDYLLRHDPMYVDMALAEAEKIESQIRASTISDADKARLSELLWNYRRDFLDLVAQNQRIDQLLVAMHEAADGISALVKETVIAADKNSARVTAEINASTTARVTAMLWIVLLAMVLGAVLSALITRRVTRPLLQMAGLLDRLAYDEPTERIPTSPGSRDEVDAMAESVNKIADHKTQLIRWWNTSMQEIEAARDLQRLDDEPGTSGEAERASAKAELAEARRKKEALLRAAHGDVRKAIERILDLREKLTGHPGGAEARSAVDAIDESARTALSVLSVVEDPDPLGSDPSAPQKRSQEKH